MLSLLLSAIIFGILYACIVSNMSFLKTLIVYIVCCVIRLAILIGGMTFGIFLISFGIYFFSGIILLLVLSRIRDSWGFPGFLIFGIIIQEIIGVLLTWLT